MKGRTIYTAVVLLIGILIGSILHPWQELSSLAQPSCQTFKETGKTVCGQFLQYWQTHGGLAQQGFPISNEFSEVSDLNGKTYTVQYFERAVFEKHPENQPPYDVLLSQLGTYRFKARYPNGEPGGQPQPTPTPQPPVSRQGDFEIRQPTRYDTGVGYTAFVGMVRYTGSQLRASPKVVLTITDSAGKLVATGSDSSIVTLLRPNTLVPYRVLIDTTLPANIRVETTVQADIASDFDLQFSYTDLEVRDSSLVKASNNYSPTKIIGRVFNIGQKTATLVHIVAAFYDASGKVVDVEDAFASLDSLVPEAASPFEIDSYYAQTATRYDLVVSGMPK